MGGAQEASRPGRWSRVLPRWVRRRPLATAVGAGVLAAAVIAGIVFLIVRPSVPQPRYAALPKQPCALVGAAERRQVPARRQGHPGQPG